MTEAGPAPETRPFQAEINQLLKLVINSLYSHKEIFLRELVSNASDALDRLRFRAVTEPELLKDDAALEVRVEPHRDAMTLSIDDTGVGMSRQELIDHLGTIARSGSKEFADALTKAGQQKDLSLIGQFGVGFYSAYLVADRVEVLSRAAGTEEAFRWSSDAHGTFTIEPAEKASRGTRVTLHLKADQTEFLEPWRLKELVKQYSDYVAHPIQLLTTQTSGEGDAKKTETTRESINLASALWQRPKSELKDEQYKEFYQHLTHDFEPPLAWTHFKAEGNQQFAGLLFIPSHPPFDLNTKERKGLRLFVKRVFIMESSDELLPPWLRFVRGVLDSDDLPLNVSRELLQDSAIVQAMRKHAIKKTLDLLEKLAKDKPEDYLKFWKSFGVTLKEGLVGDPEYKERLGNLARYASSHAEGLTSLAEYISRMPEGQESLYYVYGESAKAVSGSPHLEALQKRGYEVLFLTDPVDEWAAQSLGKFMGKSLISAMQANLKLPETEEQKAEQTKQAESLRPLAEHIKEILKDQVKDVRVSERLTDSPCCLVLPEGVSPAFLERLLKESGRGTTHQKRILELNPSHPVVKYLEAAYAKDPSSARVKDWVELLYDQALLTEGSTLEDPNRFARRMNAVLVEAAGARAS